MTVLMVQGYVAVARLKCDNSIVEAYPFDKKEDAENFIKNLRELKLDEDDEVYLKVEEYGYEHHKFWNRTK